MAYLNPTVPADGAILALTAHAPVTGQIFGLTESGWKISSTFSETSEEADETSIPFNKIVDVETMKAETSWFQMEDFTLLKLFAPTGSYTLNAGVSEKITFGGALLISATAKPGLLIVTRQTAAPTLDIYVQLYQAVNVSGIEYDLTRKKSARVPVSMEALSQTARTAGDQAGAIVKLLA